MDSAAPSKDDYHIGIITALAIERAAITAMLDEEYECPDDFHQTYRDTNSYTWGRIGVHSIVIASLAAGVYGNTMATTTAIPMLYSFPNLKFGLMVGIGAGIPTTAHDVRLGDVVVSQPSGLSGGVFQYDLGKAKDNEWERKDFLARPPEVLLKALNKLQTVHEFRIPQSFEHLHSAAAKHEYWSQSYSRPDTSDDRLFPSSYKHDMNSMENTCSACDPTKAIKRTERPAFMDFKIHYGVIASGNSLVKDAELRDWIASMEKQCLCIEMEAAGLMNNFPCLVIRGICDYADTHKDDRWQRYACATAAALSKELLTYVPLTDSTTATKLTEVLQISTEERFIPLGPIRSASGQIEHSQSSSQLPSNNPARYELPARSTTDTQISTSAGISTVKTGELANPPSELEATENIDLYKDLLVKAGKVNARVGENDDTLLHLAVREGNTRTAAELINSGADIETGNKKQETPLYVAAQEGRLEIAKLLIQHKVNIAAQTEHGATPFHIAAEKGHYDIAKLLVEQKANVEATYNGCTPLFVAATHGHLDIVELLVVECNANIQAAKHDGSTPLYTAARNGHAEVVKLLVEHRANIEAKSDGCTPLHIAAQNGHAEVLKILAEHGANTEAKWNWGTPLFAAATNGYSEVVRVLLEHSAIIEAESDGCTALNIAATNGHLEVVRLLVEHRANIETKSGGHTPLLNAASRGHAEVVKYLIDHKANIEATDWFGLTPLYSAVTEDRNEAVKVLIENGANTHAKAFMIPVRALAADSKRKEIVELFEACKLNEKPKENSGGGGIRGFFKHKKTK